MIEYETARARLIRRLRYIAQTRPSITSWVSKAFNTQDCDDLDQAAALLEVCGDCGHCFNVARIRGLTDD